MFIYDKPASENLPRAFDVISDHSTSYADISTKWFTYLRCEVKLIHKVLVYDKEYEVEVRYIHGQPCGFTGKGWQSIYKDFQMYQYRFVVFNQYYNDVFRVSFFRHDLSEFKPHGTIDLDIFTHKRILYSADTDAIVCIAGHITTMLCETTEEGIQTFDVKSNCNISKIRYAILPNKKYTKATVKSNNYQTEMELHTYRAKRLRREHSKRQVMLRGDWKGLLSAINCHIDETLRMLYRLQKTMMVLQMISVKLQHPLQSVRQRIFITIYLSRIIYLHRH